MNVKRDFFISSASSDRSWAEWIAWTLEEAGFTTWLDRADLRSGTDWEVALADAHDQARQIIAVLSPGSLTSANTRHELEQALAGEGESRVRLIPVRVSEFNNEDLMARLQYIDLVGLDEEAAKAALLEGVRGVRRPPGAPAFPGRAERSVPINPGFPDLSTLRQALEFTIEAGDITRFPADIVALKYARDFHGADRVVAKLLSQKGVAVDDLFRPDVGVYSYGPSSGAIAAPKVLFVGLPHLAHLGYAEVREFGRQAISALAKEDPGARHIAMTVHGPGFGLDEIEAFLSLFAGTVESVAEHPTMALRRISIVDINDARVERFGLALQEDLAEAGFRADVEGGDGVWFFRLGVPNSVAEALASELAVPELPGSQSESKAHVFVAMPFAENMEDVFHFGIQEPARAAGFLCERVDQEAFTGDILQRVKARIETAALIVADLTGSNPNVFLEVGYAWGRDRPTVLLAKENEKLRFDVQGQRCLKYRTIKQLRDSLAKELNDLKDQVSGRDSPS